VPNIIDVIIHRPWAYHGAIIQEFVIVDVAPRFLFERRGSFLVAEDDGFFECYQEQPGTKDAFAGREFDLSMKDGSAVHAKGQIWYGGHARNAPYPIVDVGIATLEQLRKCYVFGAGHVSREKWNAWLAENAPSEDYWKYDPRGWPQFAMAP
jgi:hypothetical protein